MTSRMPNPTWWRSPQVGLFAAVCLIWGLTWIPAKIGLSSVPPILFAASRGLAAGAILLGIHWWRVGPPALERRHIPRLLAVGLLANAATYSLLFWGMARIESGLAAVVNLSLIPISLLVIAVLMGEERLTGTKAVAAALGVAGLTLLFTSGLGSASTGARSAGVVAVALSAIAYGMGSVLSRDLLRRYSPILIGGLVQAVGGGTLLPLSMLVEPGSPAQLKSLADPPVLLSWGFLVLFGSVIAFTAYLRLTHEWSPSRAGLYAFVSPAIAVLAGVGLLGEGVTPRELSGMALMMTGTILAFRGARSERRADPSPLPSAGHIKD